MYHFLTRPVGSVEKSFGKLIQFFHFLNSAWNNFQKNPKPLWKNMLDAIVHYYSSRHGKSIKSDLFLYRVSNQSRFEYN